MADVSLSCINKMERGKTNPPHHIVARVADALGYELDLVLKH